MLKFFLTVLFSSLLSTAYADGPSCADLQKAFAADLMNVTESSCATTECRARALEQLRATVQIFTGSSVAEHKHSLQLNADYDPRFFIYSVGNADFEAVNIDYAGQPLVALFTKGTVAYAGIQIAGGKVFVGREPCQTKFKPVVNLQRRRNVCASLVPALHKKKPQLHFDVAACESSDPKTRLDVFIEDFNETSMKLRVQRKLKDLGGGYFACDVLMDRRDSTVQSLSCMVL